MYTDANNMTRVGEREGDGLVVGQDRMDHGTDSWAWPDNGAHLDVLAAIAAIRAGLRALPRERLAVSLPSSDALRHESVARADLEVVDDTVDRLSLLTLGERSWAARTAAVPVTLPPQAPDAPLARARAGLGLTPFKVGVLAPDPAALRDMSCRPGDVAGALGDCMVATLAASDPAPGGLQRGGSRATEGVRGPRPAERRPGA